MTRRALARKFARIGAAAFAARASAATVESQTFTYKKVGGLEIKADVHRWPDRTNQPVAVWIHGGALINGSRERVPPRLKEPLIEAGFAIVSIDYRLAPETKLPSIIEDLEDAFAWIRRDGPKLFAVDPDRIAALGSSAGGYLTLTSGFRAKPAPQALVSFWGYGDLIGSWYSAPSPHERHQRVKLTRAQALAEVSGPPIASSSDRNGNGGAFYQHCRRHGIWPREVSGWDPSTEADRFTPYMPVRNVSASYPPTLMIHGTADTDVPYDQSVMMASEFLKHGVEHRLITVEGAEHGLAGADEKAIDDAYSDAVEFIKTQLG